MCVSGSASQIVADADKVLLKKQRKKLLIPRLFFSCTTLLCFQSSFAKSKKEPQVEVFNQAAEGKYRDFNQKLFDSSKHLVIGVAACGEPLRKEPGLLFKSGTLTYLQRQSSDDAVILTVDIAAPCSNELLDPRRVQRLP